ncbi:MAG: RcnB family protein [Caulobacteraceae bacterium]|nr:RcnB family protein [Caulobacteraceae bacterium]
MRPDHRYQWRGDRDWRAPRGFYERRWRYGERLPFGWFARSFWMSDYYDYDLPVPPYGYQWIRLGPDIALVNIRTGLIVETIYDFFY